MSKLGLVIDRRTRDHSWRATYRLDGGALWMPDWLQRFIGHWFNVVACRIWGHDQQLLYVWLEYADLSEPRCPHCSKWLAQPYQRRGTKTIADLRQMNHELLSPASGRSIDDGTA